MPSLQAKLLSSAQNDFDFSVLKPEQTLILSLLYEGHSVIGILPTGYGKSLCYQLPCVTWGWKVLVVVPLLSLLQDQKARARRLGLRVFDFHSQAMAEDQVKGAEALRKGDWDMAFISPERLVLWMRSGFWTKISSQVSLLTFDEAHCLVEWRGFRPLFQELEERIAVAGINLPPLLLLSATLSPESLEDLARRWRREFRGVRAQVGRENLYLAVESFSEEKHRWLRLAGHLRNLESPKAAIVYCGTRREAELVAAFLQSGGLGAVAYHAGLAPQRRRRLEDAFRLGRLRVVCATSAFGLGIDYPFVERVIHWGPPDDISSYWQEAGRAGRSGSPAYCFLLWLRSDFFLWRDRIRKAAQNEVKTKWKNFKRMAAFLRTNQCRKAWVASELGWSSPACGNCDQCHRNQAQSSHLPWSYIDEKENLAWWLAPELELIYRDWPESRWVMDSSVEWEQEYCQELSDKSLD